MHIQDIADEVLAVAASIFLFLVSLSLALATFAAVAYFLFNLVVHVLRLFGATTL